jgi:uncharacterized protein (UPF0335 family)
MQMTAGQKDHLKRLVDEVEDLDARRGAIGKQIGAAYKLGRGHGLDVKAVKRVVSLRRLGNGAQGHLEATSLYMAALDDLPLEAEIARQKAGSVIAFGFSDDDTFADDPQAEGVEVVDEPIEAEKELAAGPVKRRPGRPKGSKAGNGKAKPIRHGGRRRGSGFAVGL